MLFCIVRLKLCPYYHINVETRKSNIYIYIVHQEWNDVNLKWNKSEYGDVADIRIPPHKLWKPDVLMYNR